MDNLRNDAKKTVKEAIAESFGLSELSTPILITCRSDDVWRDKLEKAEIDYAYIDAWSMSYGALKGIRDRTCELYEPEWFIKLKQCGVLVLNNFDAVGEKGSSGETWGSAFGVYSLERPIRDDYKTLFCKKMADKERRLFREGIYIPDDAITLVINNNEAFDLAILPEFWGVVNIKL